MRALISSAMTSLGLALALSPQSGLSQPDRDYVFADLEGHLVMRFVGTGATGLGPSQAEEVVNAELSSMVHDRLRADLLFEAEPRDPEWAAVMEPQLDAHVRHVNPELADFEFSAIATECRAGSCRVVMEHPGHWTVPMHRAVLEAVQASLEAFTNAHPQQFEPVFMITAYYQEWETPHIKAFLRRTDQTAAQKTAKGTAHSPEAR